VLAAADCLNKSALEARLRQALGALRGARVASAQRVEIRAFHAARAAIRAAVRAGRTARKPLADYLSAPADAPQLQSIPGSGVPTFSAEVPLDGRLYRRA